MSLTVSAYDYRDIEQRCLVQAMAVYAVGRESAVPEAGEHERVGGLALRGFEVGHGDEEIVDF
jgi:hypothetical protein